MPVSKVVCGILDSHIHTCTQTRLFFSLLRRRIQKPTSPLSMRSIAHDPTHMCASLKINNLDFIFFSAFMREIGLITFRCFFLKVAGMMGTEKFALGDKRIYFFPLLKRLTTHKSIKKRCRRTSLCQENEKARFKLIVN